MRTLKPIIDHASYHKPLESLIWAHFNELIFAPLEAILSDIARFNAVSKGLENALRTGKISYVAPYFYGSLTAQISKELRRAGAVYNKTKKAYKLEQSSLPLDLKVVISQAKQAQMDKVNKIENFLIALEGREIKPINIEIIFGDILDKLKKQFDSSVKPLTAKDIEIPIEPHLNEQLKEAYAKNLEPYIQDWHDTEILRLRKKVYQNVSTGFRAENLIETIRQEKQVSYNKAKFLAKQETSLLVAKYRQVRYEEVGITEYIWSTSHDKRVRDSHRELQGKKFSYANPPITNIHTMARNNPGQDFGCRCVDIPVVPTRVELRKGTANV